ncbi:MAG TPA: response regulator [Ktedonobacterales bacterium]|nr:response regulator [Ktedonobacterales bacterium]
MIASQGLPTVLIVEDNPDLLDLLLLSLPRLGPFKVYGVSDGIAGLEQFYEQRPQCVVIDIKMPGLDGYQLVRALRGDPETAATPLIILTALAQQRDHFAGLAAGADLYLIKPVTPQALVEAIHQVIRVSEAERLQRLEALLEEEPPEPEIS